MPAAARQSLTYQDLPPRHVALALALVLAFSALLLWWGFIPNYGAGVDEASYFLAGKGLAAHADPAYHNPDPTVFVPENMIETRPGWFYPKYPIGYPLLCAAAYRAGMGIGAAAEAPFLVNPVLILLALAGLFLLCRLFLDRLFSLAVVFFMALHPVCLFYGNAALSHAGDLACSIWCLYFAYSWYLRPVLPKAAAAGVLLGFAVSIRYTEVLLALPLAWLLCLHVRRAWCSRPAPAFSARAIAAHASLAGVLALVGVAPLLGYHVRAFGSPFLTGYSFTREASAFSLANFNLHFPRVIAIFCGMANGLSLLFPLALAGMAYLLRKFPAAGLFLTLWCIPTLLLYSSYYWVNNQYPLLYIRFFLTLFPGFLIAAFMLLHVLTRRWPLIRYGIVLLLVIHVGFTLERMTPLSDIEGTARIDQIATSLVRRSLPPDAVVLADGYSAYSLVYYTDMTILYPRYFVGSWVQKRLLPPDKKDGAIADFNPLRTQRFAAALGGRSDEQLSLLLLERLGDYCRAGRTVALLVQDDPTRWQAILGATFTLTPIASDDTNKIFLYRLAPRPAQP